MYGGATQVVVRASTERVNIRGYRDEHSAHLFLNGAASVFKRYAASAAAQASSGRMGRAEKGQSSVVPG